jgi:hypothetical protein
MAGTVSESTGRQSFLRGGLVALDSLLLGTSLDSVFCSSVEIAALIAGVSGGVSCITSVSSFITLTGAIFRVVFVRMGFD